MTSTLIITSVEQLQKKIVQKNKELKDKTGVYINLNKPWEATETMLGGHNSNIFFIDCVSNQELGRDVIHIQPDDLETLSLAIKEYMKHIKGEKYIFIDTLATFLIYNHENKVAKFVQELVAHVDDKTTVIACSPETKGEDLLNKIFNFFDEVER